MTTTIKSRRDSAAAWTAANSILALGELGVEIDPLGVADRLKVGDGVTTWNARPYLSVVAGVILLAAGAAIPGGTPANTIIARTP